MKYLAGIVMISSLIQAGDFVSRINEVINKALREQSPAFNGVIIIAQGEKILFQKASGKFVVPALDSQFVLGSISKQFTAAIVLKLVDKGLIDINMPLKKYLPELVDDWASRVTVKNLLNHTSGIIKLGKSLDFEPGTQFCYSPTLAFYLASCIAEKVSGTMYEELLHDLFTQANMRGAAVLCSADMEANYAKYPKLLGAFKEENKRILPVALIGENGMLYDRSWNPGGGIIATAADLVCWNTALHGGKLLSPQSYAHMITPSSQREHPRYGLVGYGFGVQVLDRDGYVEISHSGYIDGYCATVLYYPHAKLSVIMLENISRDSSDMIRAFRVHDEIRGIDRTMLCQ